LPSNGHAFKTVVIEIKDLMKQMVFQGIWQGVDVKLKILAKLPRHVVFLVRCVCDQKVLFLDSEKQTHHDGS